MRAFHIAGGDNLVSKMRQRRGRSSREGGFGLQALEARIVLSDTVLGSADPVGLLTLSRTTPQGQVEIVQQAASGAATRLVGLDLSLGAPALTSQPVMWADPRNGFTYGAAPSAQGLIVFRQLPGGSWSWRNLSSDLGAPVMSNLTVLSGQDASVSIVGVQAGGDLAMIRKDAGDWSYQNLSDDLRSQGFATPVFTTALASYVTPWDARNIVGLDAQGQIQAVWWAPGMTRWRSDNLSQATGAPAMQGDITAYTLPWGHMAIVGLNGGRALATWWTPELGAGNWQTVDLSAQTGAPELRPGSISSFTTAWNAQNIVGLDSSGQLSVLWWAPGMTDWYVSSNLVAGAPEAGGPVRGVASPTGTINLVGLSPSGDVTRYYWNPGGDGAWRFENISQAAVTVQPSLDSVPLDFLDITGIGKPGGGTWTYHAVSTDPSNGPSGTVIGISTPGPGGTFNWTLDASSLALPNTVVGVPHTTFQRRADGVYLTSISAVDGADGEDVSLNFPDLKLSPRELTGTFTDSAPLNFPIPDGMTGEVAGTVTLRITREGTEMVSTSWGTVATVRITMTIGMTISGWTDAGEGDGREYGTITATSNITMNSVPGVGIVQVVETATATISDSEGDDTETLGMRGWLDHLP